MFNLGKIFGALKLSPTLSSLLNSRGVPEDPRKQFCMVLLATVDHVNQKPNFNLELEINDLWTRLGNLRQQQQAGSPLAAKIAGQISGLSEGLTKSMEAILKNIK